MADKSFGVDQLDILGTGTPTISAPNQLNLECNTVAISTSVTVGQNLTVSANAGIASLNVTGIATVVNFNATGISTIASPSDTNSHSRWKVSNNGSSAYRFTGPGQDGSENNPNVYLVRGQRYIFDVNASGHPFQLRVANGGAAYSDGVSNNGAQSGQVIFNVQHDAPAQLYYQCTNHGSMVGNIYIVGGPQVISGVLTATSFSGSGANLTSLPAQATIANNADNRVITGGSGVNLNGEANLKFDGGGTLTIVDTELTESTDNFSINIQSGNNDLYVKSGGTIFAAFKGANSDLQLTSGNLVIGTSGKGIDFSAAGNVGGMTSELLDDYEEGSFTPQFGSSGSNMTFTTQQGSYTKVGNLVYVKGYIRINTINANGSGTVFIQNLPFANSSTGYGGLYINYTHGMNNVEITHLILDPNSSSAALYQHPGPGNANMVNATVASAFANSAELIFSGTYNTN